MLTLAVLLSGVSVVAWPAPLTAEPLREELTFETLPGAGVTAAGDVTVDVTVTRTRLTAPTRDQRVAEVVLITALTTLALNNNKVVFCHL